MKILTARMAAALENGYPRGLFAAIDHPDGTGYFCTGVRRRIWNGHTWMPVGRLGSITPMKHTSEIAIQDITFSLSGIDTEVTNRLNSDVRNRIGETWLFCTSPADDTVVRDPYPMLSSELDYQTFEVADDGTSTINILAHAGFYTLSRGIMEAWTPENQKLTYPDDIGFDQIPILQNQDLKWLPS